jgi:hypothetical protein
VYSRVGIDALSFGKEKNFLLPTISVFIRQEIKFSSWAENCILKSLQIYDWQLAVIKQTKTANLLRILWNYLIKNTLSALLI